MKQTKASVSQLFVANKEILLACSWQRTSPMRCFRTESLLGTTRSQLPVMNWNQSPPGPWTVPSAARKDKTPRWCDRTPWKHVGRKLIHRQQRPKPEQGITKKITANSGFSIQDLLICPDVPISLMNWTNFKVLVMDRHRTLWLAAVKVDFFIPKVKKKNR